MAMAVERGKFSSISNQCRTLSGLFVCSRIAGGIKWYLWVYRWRFSVLLQKLDIQLFYPPICTFAHGCLFSTFSLFSNPAIQGWGRKNFFRINFLTKKIKENLNPGVLKQEKYFLNETKIQKSNQDQISIKLTPDLQTSWIASHFPTLARNFIYKTWATCKQFIPFKKSQQQHPRLAAKRFVFMIVFLLPFPYVNVFRDAPWCFFKLFYKWDQRVCGWNPVTVD